MLPHKNRLLKEQDFAKIYRSGKKVSTSHLTLFYLPNHQATSRFGFTISKKQAGTIVVRNRLKRILRAGVRTFLAQIPAGRDVLILPRAKFLRLPGPARAEELFFLLSKAKLLKEKK